MLNPTSMHVDFEPAMHNAVLSTFPNARIECCRFHLGQAWWRHIQKIGQYHNTFVLVIHRQDIFFFIGQYRDVTECFMNFCTCLWLRWEFFPTLTGHGYITFSHICPSTDKDRSVTRICGRSYKASVEEITVR
jgi:hypothetical protein